MKNKIILIIFAIFQISFVIPTNVLSQENFKFEVSEIEIDQKNKKIIGNKRGVITSNLGELIEADKFEYNQINNTLKVEGNVIFKNPDGSLITGDQLIYNKTKNYLSANGNIIIDDNKSYKIYADKINYFKNDNKIITVGETRGVVNGNYKIETKNLIFLRDDMLFYSGEEIKFYNEIKDSFLSLKSFSYSISNQRLKGEDVILIRGYKSPLNEKYFLKSAHIDLKNDSFLTEEINIELKKDIFGNKNNDPRLAGVSSSSKNGITTINKGKFTSCKKNKNCTPWSIQASKIIHNKEKKKISYNNAVLKIYDVPVLYFPKFFHPDPTVNRQSGFLAPRFNNSSVLGTSVKVPYYLVLADNKDMTFSPTVFDKNTQMLQTEFRHVDSNSTLTTDFNFVNGYQSKNQNKDKTLFHFFGNYRSNLNIQGFNSSTLALDFYNVNNNSYLKVFDNNLSNSSLKPQNPDVLSSQIKLNLDHSDYNFTTGFASFENLKKDKNDSFEYVLPYYNFSTQLKNSNFGLLNFISIGENILKDTNNFRSRMINDLDYETFDFISDSGFKNNINFTIKNLITSGNSHNEHDSSPEIELMGLIEAQTAFPMIKESSNNINYFNPKISLRFNPSDMKNYSKDNRQIYNGNLFDLNRLGLFDTLESGQSLTVGFEYKKEKVNNINKYFEFNLGKIFRDKSITEIPESSTINNKESNLIGSITNNMNENIKFNYDFSVNDNLNELEYNAFGTTLSINNFVTSFNYIEESNKIGSTHIVENNTSYDFSDKYSIKFRTRRNREINLTEYYDLIYEYKNDCLVAGINYNKTYYSDRDLEPSENFMFTIKLIPLTTFGQNIDR